MNLVKICLIIILTSIFVSQGLSLSCSAPDHQFTFHCPADEVCNENVTVRDSDSIYEPHISFTSTQIPDVGKTTENKRQIYKENSRPRTIVTRTVRNGELPDAGKALERSDNLCNPGANIHLYPKEEFEEQELHDTSKCYKTVVNQAQHYYTVHRTGTTRPLFCNTKVTGQRVSGGETHYAAPVTLGDVLTHFMSSIISNLRF